LKKRGLNAQLVVVNGIQHYETYKFVDALPRSRALGSRDLEDEMKSRRQEERGFTRRAWSAPRELSAVGVLTRQAAAVVGREVPRDSDAKNIGEYVKRMSARPHHLGSSYDKDNAEWILSKFKEWGWDARIETVRRALSNARKNARRNDRADGLHVEAGGAAGRSRPDIGQKSEQLPSYQRLFDRR
jgi:hypothetical protein